MECSKCNGTGQISRLGLVIERERPRLPTNREEDDPGPRPGLVIEHPTERQEHREQLIPEPGHMPAEEWSEPTEWVTCPRCHGTGEARNIESSES